MIPKDRLLSVKEVKNAELERRSPFDNFVRTVMIIGSVLILLFGWVVIKF